MKQGEGLCCDEYDIMFVRPSVNDTIYILCDNGPSNVHYAKPFVQSCFQSIANQELFGVLLQGCYLSWLRTIHYALCNMMIYILYIFDKCEA